MLYQRGSVLGRGARPLFLEENDPGGQDVVSQRVAFWNATVGYGPQTWEGLWSPPRVEPVSGPELLSSAAGQAASHSRLADLLSTSATLDRRVSFPPFAAEAAPAFWAHHEPTANSLPTGSLSVTTDHADYAPGGSATFTASGIRAGASVTFQIADLLSAPGANGLADVYTPFTIGDGGTGDLDGRVNGTVVAQWQVPADGRATGATLQLTATSGGQTATATFSDASNKIVTENQLAGTPQSTWAIHGSIASKGDSQIEGFATQISTNAGQTVSFKIQTASSVNGYTLDIYRLGYYGGNGARLINSMHHTGTDNQPSAIFNTATRTVDAGNWSVTDSWTIPSTAVSGVYFAKLTSDTGGYQNMIPFIVRNDSTTSDILFQTSDTTWEAYNPWGGYNLYAGPNGRSDRAYAVSYNRPIAMNSTAQFAGPQDFLFGEEYAAIYWLEQNGYDLNYISGIDAASNAPLLRNTKVYIDVGHDEYWSQSQFANVKAAAGAGVNLGFLSGNQIYWDIALAPSYDSSQTPNRTVVEYKDIWSGTQLDPNGTAGGGAGLFRDPVYGPGTPENSLSGTIFTVDDLGTLDNISVPASMSQLRFWRNTSIASGNGGTLTGLLGYEWDSDLDNGFRPAGLIDMSSTTRNVNTLLLDNGLTTGPGTATHSLTLYRNPTSGALVFGAGTVMWSWGLSNQYAPYSGLTEPVSPAVQQSMVNLFADMGVTPQTLQASLVLAQASTDHTAPTAVISSPTGGTSFSQGQSVTINGTASDVGGRVAGIEVSTDGGTTWHPANGTTSWSYTWVASGAGTHLIEARATDDSVNLQTSPATVSINVGGGGSLFTASNTPAQTDVNDGRAIEVGVKFTSSTAGQITALKFYRSPGDTGSDLLDLWSSTGTKLASATFSNTAATGWQTVTLPTPVSIAANTTYVASYHTSGTYVVTSNFFTSAVTSGPLTAPSSASSGGNGVYSYGGTSSAGIFPTSTFNAENYWADVVLSTSSGTDTAPVLTNQTPDQNAVVGSAFSLTLPANTFTDSDGDPLAYAATLANGSALPAWLTFNASTRTFSGTPTSSNVGTISVKTSATDPGGFSASETFNIAVTTTAAVSLFAASSTPAQTNLNDGTPLEVGVKFTSSTAGQITALKFYRSPGDTGSDLLDLWSSTGTKLASATFSNTTATGWQTVTLATPVSIAANTTYVASYHTSGAYVVTSNFFTSAVTSGPLTAPSSASSGGNGVYSYGGTSSAGIFPTSTFSASNYWADVVFNSSGGTDTAPVLTNQTPDQNATVGSAFSLTLPANTFTDSDGDPLAYAATLANGSALPAWLTFNASTRTFSGTPTSSNVGTISVKTSATDPGGFSASETFNIAVTTTAPVSLFAASSTPAQTNLNDGTPLEVGVKFTSSTAGQITALKFYRSPGDTGSDLLDLWSSTGTKLASATFSNTTATGWQTVTLATPVSIAANTTYVASYHTSGAYVVTNNFFTNSLTSGPLTAPSSASSGGNGVYAYGGTNSAGLFPTSSFSASNYYADVVFQPQLAA
ncbi:DUF4082 domain-containing protein [Bradyrhizobium vignae]|uniref:Mo-co oxidoreductase dimerization domain n=1 Tax=Bradyrhizobium vignae TaxID=1549949 RepID=A0A2U3PXK0_9BRAD|nr:Mo-co oxidoreductase dimerization domain [Bradyrhizobium vignae]